MKRQIVIDLSNVQSIEAFHDVVAQCLKFPHYYGRNPNAFWDCLTDIIEDLHVEVHGFSVLNKDLKDEIRQYMQMLEEYREVSQGKFDYTVDDETM